jgi:hypothetical protein
VRGLLACVASHRPCCGPRRRLVGATRETDPKPRGAVQHVRRCKAKKKKIKAKEKPSPSQRNGKYCVGSTEARAAAIPAIAPTAATAAAGSATTTAAPRRGRSRQRPTASSATPISAPSDSLGKRLRTGPAPVYVPSEVGIRAHGVRIADDTPSPAASTSAASRNKTSRKRHATESSESESSENESEDSDQDEGSSAARSTKNGLSLSLPRCTRTRVRRMLWRRP